DYLPETHELLDDELLWRVTWTPNRPLVLWESGAPHGYVIGCTRRTIPTAMSMDPKKAAKALHARDYAHVWDEDSSSSAEPRAIIAPERLLSLEGAHRWYTNHLDTTMRNWQRKTIVPQSASSQIGFHIERTDTHGHREHSSWTEVDLA